MSSRQSEDDLAEYKARRKSRASSENIKRYTASSLNKVLVKHLSKIAAKYVPMAAIEKPLQPDDYNLPEMRVFRVPRSKSGSRVWGSVSSYSRYSSRGSQQTSRKTSRASRASRASSRASRSTVDETPPVQKTDLQISDPKSQADSVRILPKGASRENAKEKIPKITNNKCGNSECESSCECSSDCDSCSSLQTSSKESLFHKKMDTKSDLPTEDKIDPENKDVGSKQVSSMKQIQQVLDKKDTKNEDTNPKGATNKDNLAISSKSETRKKGSSDPKIPGAEPISKSSKHREKEDHSEYSKGESDTFWSVELEDMEELSEESEEEEESSISEDSVVSEDEFMKKFIEAIESEDEADFNEDAASSTTIPEVESLPYAEVGETSPMYMGGEISEYEDKSDVDGGFQVVCRCAIPENFDPKIGYSTCDCHEPGELSDEIESYAIKIRDLRIEMESQKAHVAKYAHEKLRIKMATVNSENFQKRMFYILSSLLVQISPKFMEIRYLIEPRAVEDFFKIAYRMLSNYARLNPYVLSNLQREIEHTEMILMLNLIMSFLAIPDIRELYNTIPAMRSLPENLIGALRATRYLPRSEPLERSIMHTLHNYCNIHNGVFMLQREIPFLQTIAKYIESADIERKLFGLLLAKLLTQCVVSKAVFNGIISQLPLELIEILADLDDKNDIQQAAMEVVNNLKRTEAELAVWAAHDVGSKHKVYMNDCRLLKGVTKICETYIDPYCGGTVPMKLGTKKKTEPLPVPRSPPKHSPRSMGSSPAKVVPKTSPPQEKSFSLVLEQLHDTVSKLNDVKEKAKENIRRKSDLKHGIGDKKSVVIHEAETDKNMS